MKLKAVLKTLLALVILCTTTLNIQTVSAGTNCQKDYYEQNNDMNSPAQLNTGQYWATICNGDIDVYKIDIAAGENVVSISGGATLITDSNGNPIIKTTGTGRTTDLPTDIDFQVYSYENGNQNWLGASEKSGTKKEEFRWTATKSGTIYVYVIPKGNILSFDPYILTVGRFPKFYMPVNGIGEGVATAIGSTAHKGVDTFAIDYVYSQDGVPVYSILPGKVVFSGWVKDYGYTVVVRHWDDSLWDKKFYSIYAHLLTPDEEHPLQVLGKVDMKTPLGYMGMTGSGSNNITHLHFAVRAGSETYADRDALYGTSKTPAFDVRPFFK